MQIKQSKLKEIIIESIKKVMNEGSEYDSHKGEYVMYFAPNGVSTVKYSYNPQDLMNLAKSVNFATIRKYLPGGNGEVVLWKAPQDVEKMNPVEDFTPEKRFK